MSKVKVTRGIADEEKYNESVSSGILDDGGSSGFSFKDDIEEYDRKLNELKEQIKSLKKIKRQQKKITKLETKKLDVLKEIEKKKGCEHKSKRHRHH